MSVKDGSTTPLLKDCPFCGGEAEMDTHRAYRSLGNYLGSGVAIYCTKCSADMMMCREDHRDMSTDDMIFVMTAAWNRRPEPSPEVGPSPPVWKDIAALADFALSDSLIDRDGNGYYGDAKFIRALAGNGYRIVPAEPSPEDVERVARAICCPSGHCHIVQINERADTARHYPQPWPCCWRQHAERARAALFAARRGCK